MNGIPPVSQMLDATSVLSSAGGLDDAAPGFSDLMSSTASSMAGSFVLQAPPEHPASDTVDQSSPAAAPLDLSLATAPAPRVESGSTNGDPHAEASDPHSTPSASPSTTDGNPTAPSSTNTGGTTVATGVSSESSPTSSSKEPGSVEQGATSTTNTKVSTAWASALTSVRRHRPGVAATSSDDHAAALPTATPVSVPTRSEREHHESSATPVSPTTANPGQSSPTSLLAQSGGVVAPISHGSAPAGDAVNRQATASVSAIGSTRSSGAPTSTTTTAGGTPSSTEPLAVTPSRASADHAPTSSSNATPASTTDPTTLGAGTRTAASDPSTSTPTVASGTTTASFAGVVASQATTTTASSSSTAHSAQLPGVASQLLSVLSPLRTSAIGTQSLTIALHPEGLGDVKATLTVNEGSMVVRLSASTPQGAEAIRSALPDLENGFRDSGGNTTLLFTPSDTGSSPGSQQHGATPEPFATPLVGSSSVATTSLSTDPVPSGTTSANADALLDVRV